MSGIKVRPSTLIFDLDNTLIWDERSMKEAFETVCLFAEQETGVGGARLEALVREEAGRLFRSYDTYSYAEAIEVTELEALWARFDRGDHPMLRRLEAIAAGYRRDVWRNALARAGADGDKAGALSSELAERFMTERRSRPFVYDDTFAALKALKPTYRMVLLTNGDPSLQQEKVDGVQGLGVFFEHIFISGHFEVGKPYPLIYEKVLEELGEEARDCWMIGDNMLTDIKGANGVGMPSVWLNRSGREPIEGIKPTFSVSSLSELADLLM
ncbi:HAD family hydrolase [Paenibacillus xanthanilyticus]|uniref:Phosphoserine phosphatase n=2 Tax=Paenibacillus xanthanilyticus TaxID=1783531 RepID=A0ABV8JTD4_9BACL